MSTLVAAALKAQDGLNAHMAETGTLSSSDNTGEDRATEDVECAPGASNPRDASLPHDFDANVEDLPELQRTWRGCFADPDVESAYRAEIFYPCLGRCMSHVLFVMATFNSLSFLVLCSRGLSPELSVERHGWTANALALFVLVQVGIFFRSSHFCNVPMHLMEVISISTLVALSAWFRFHQLLEPSSACATNATLMLRLGAFVALVSAYVPLTVPAFCIVCGASITIGATLDLYLPDESGWCPYNLASLCMLGFATTVCRYHVSKTARGEWAFRRTVVLAQRERKYVHRRFEHARSARLHAQHGREALAAAAARAEEGKLARARLIRVVMHDLRSPLLSVLNVTKLLREGHEGKKAATKLEMDKLLDVLGTCCALMENIVSDILDFERIDSGRLVLVRQPFTLERLLHESHATFEGLAKEKGVELVRAAIDQQLGGTVWNGDKWRLLQCLNNGVSNAIKFTDRGGAVYLRCWLGSDEERQQDDGVALVHIAVVDTGTGLSPDQVEQLNTGECFTQVGSGQLQGRGGTGLGLSISKSILKLHDSSELVISSPGEGMGSTFEMRLYLQPSSQPVPAHAISEHMARGRQRQDLGRDRAAAASSHSLAERLTQLDQRSSVPSVAAARDEQTDDEMAQSFKQPGTSSVTPLVIPPNFCCLHVEDDAFLQLTLPLTTFQTVGAPWQTAENGEKAIEMLEERKKSGLPPYDLILMDNQMPRMNGATAVRLMRAGGFAGMIVGMTGDPIGSPDRSEFEAAGLTACIEKDSSGCEYICRVLRSFMLPIATSASRRASYNNLANHLGELGAAVGEEDDDDRNSNRSGSVASSAKKASSDVATVP